MSRYRITPNRGIIPALVTPFAEDETFDEKRMRSVVSYLLSQKIDGLYLTGSTGEAFLMTSEERKRVLEVAIDEVGGRVPVVAHVGAIGTKISIELAQHAEAAGADAISSVPPFYWSFSSDQVVGYYRDLARATQLPLLAYNISLAGLMNFDLMKRLAEIDNLVGVKYTAATHADILRLREELGESFLVYSGADEMAMSGLAFGADGIIGAFYNNIPEVFVPLRDAMVRGDLAEATRLQRIANAVIFFSLERGMVSTIKRTLAWLGHDAGYSRRPLGGHVSLEAEATLKEDFRRLRDEHALTGVAFLDAI